MPFDQPSFPAPEERIFAPPAPPPAPVVERPPTMNSPPPPPPKPTSSPFKQEVTSPNSSDEYVPFTSSPVAPGFPGAQRLEEEKPPSKQV